MKKRSCYKKFFSLSVAIVGGASLYPVYMGIYLLKEMLQNGAVPLECYPKYVIPYTPIALALLLGILLLPLIQKLFRKLDLLWVSLFSTILFFVIERFMETKILVQTKELVQLESWQMSLCYVPPEEYQTRTWEAVDILLGGYSPAFKLHFYLISIVILVSLLNCFYGFAKMISTGDDSRKKVLTIQAITSIAFLGMCIWACFTSFYRTGEITVSALSALLMAVFFVLFGVTMGVFIGSYTMGKKKIQSIVFPSIIASLFTFAMYIGEMILLNGNLYRFGNGFLFNGLGCLVFAPIDLLVIIISGSVTAIICIAVNGGRLIKNRKKSFLP